MRCVSGSVVRKDTIVQKRQKGCIEDNRSISSQQFDHNRRSQSKITSGPAPAPSLTLGVDGVLVKDGLVSGQLVFVNCDSRGGSPTPTLALTLDGSPLDTSNGPLSHAITASPELNTKVLACSAINRAMDKHTVTETVLRVHCESCYPWN